MLFVKDHSKISIRSKNLSYSSNGVDDDAKAILEYDNKFTSNIHVSFKENLDNCCIIQGTKGYIKIKEPWLPNLNSEIEVSSNNHFYLKTINSKLSVYTNQIEKVSESFINPNAKVNLFNIEKSLVNMRLISNWMDNKN